MLPARIFRWWPWVTRRRYETLKQENYALRETIATMRRDGSRVLRAVEDRLAEDLRKARR